MPVSASVLGDSPSGGASGRSFSTGGSGPEAAGSWMSKPSATALPTQHRTALEGGSHLGVQHLGWPVQAASDVHRCRAWRTRTQRPGRGPGSGSGPCLRACGWVWWSRSPPGWPVRQAPRRPLRTVGSRRPRRPPARALGTGAPAVRRSGARVSPAPPAAAGRCALRRGDRAGAPPPAGRSAASDRPGFAGRLAVSHGPRPPGLAGGHRGVQCERARAEPCDRIVGAGSLAGTAPGALVGPTRPGSASAGRKRADITRGAATKTVAKAIAASASARAASASGSTVAVER